MTLRELQKLAHDLRSHSNRICKTASLTELQFRADQQGIVVIAGWGTGQLQIRLPPEDLIGRPCENSQKVAKRLLLLRLGGERTTDAETDPSRGAVPGATS